MTQAYDRLKALLAELFQFDREDLDFGIYRIMNQKRDEVSKFLDEDLLPQVQEAFREYGAEDEEGARRELATLEKTLGDAGVTAESSPKYVTLRKKLAASEDVAALENEVYSDLYTFFRRYYKNGDFLSLRRYKEGVYALPYEGEEVKLHWANADQYYVKTAENFRRYRFGLEDGGRVGFELVSAATERDNNKAANGRERRFVLREEDPVEERDDELRICFEYRPHPDKQADLNARALQTIFDHAPGEWKARLAGSAPTQSRPERTVLEKHLEEYTARNTFDYFVHKDLGRFLNRELDFFLKNEVLHIDDLDTGDERRVGQYLSRMRIIKRIGRKIVAFLAQIEDFQKKLFLKKKFVVHSDYCLTLDHVPQEMYEEISTNEAQYDEWERLFSISAIEPNLENGTGDNRSAEWLKANPHLVLDTKFFDDDFKDRLLASIEDLDEKTDGLLVESENFQALNLLQARYRERVKCIYIDPPYNTGDDGFLYKDQYQHSSWLSMMEDRLLEARELLSDEGVIFTSIDEHEFHGLKLLSDMIFGRESFVADFVWQAKKGGGGDVGTVVVDQEYVPCYRKTDNPQALSKLATTAEQLDLIDERGQYRRGRELNKWGAGSRREDRPTMYFPIPGPGNKDVYPIRNDGTEGRWRWGRKRMLDIVERGDVDFVKRSDDSYITYEKIRSEDSRLKPYRTWLTDVKTTADGSKTVREIFGRKAYSFPKPVELLEHLTSVGIGEDTQLLLDFFAGSGTTGHAVINLNREDGGSRKYVLVEMGGYFDSVLKPRIQKVVYSKDWRDGKPVSREGVRHIFKYVRLESYEDTLNNLSLRRTEVQDDLIRSNPALRESYTISYMMDFETKGSPSLLDLDAFEDPFSYTLDVTRDDETRAETVDLVETFGYLLGLAVRRRYTADGFRVVEGTDPAGAEVLVIWRNTREKSNDDLDAFFEAQGFAGRSFDRVYANGDNTLALKTGEGGPKVHLIEEEFRRLMFEVEGV
ncbi:MAG: site-specific DNA-methyltransferase [Rubrobacter sp.]